MKTFFILALLAVACAAEEFDGYVDPVRVVDSADFAHMPEENLRVNFVDNYADEEVGYEPIAPSELEAPLLPNGIPEDIPYDENVYPYRPILHPTWR